MDRVECRNEDCDYWAPGYVAAFAFETGCPWCEQ
jgi:hypothetical protein